MTTKFGIQCQFDSGDAERYNRELRPTHVMVINVVKRKFLERLKADNPGVKLIYRHWPNYDWKQPTPEDAALQAVIQLGIEIAPISGLLDYVTDNNEYILSKDHMAPADIEAGDRYMAAFIKEARRALNMGTFWGNFNTGHWGAETVDYFPRALAAANADGDSPICFHEYNWPAIPDPEYWTCGKILRAMPPILAQYPDVRCAITEFGVDDGGNPHKGWKLAHDDYAQAVKMFCDGIVWYRDEVMAKAPYLDTVLFFGCGMVSPWETFDVAPIISDIKTALGSSTPEPPPPEEPPMSDEIKVVDMNNQVRDPAWAIAKYGVAFRRAEVEAGQQVYRLVELREKTGNASLITKVVDADGNPLEKKDVAFYWIGAPDPPEPATEVHDNDWYRNFVHGLTNVNGDVGPGMGKGAYHGEGEGGPHAVWVRDPNIPSDICEKLGMLAGTFHDHLDQVIMLTIASSEEEPEPPGDTELMEIRRETVTGVASSMLYICFPKDESLVHDRATFAGIEGSDLDLDTSDWEHYTDALDNRWIRSGVCADWVGEATPRTYWIQAHDLPSITNPFGPQVSAQFERDVKKEVCVFLGYGESPEPPEEPPSGDVVAILLMMADAHKTLATAHLTLAACHEKLAEIE